MFCLWQLWMLCLARISGLKEAGCHCVPHGTSKQCLNYSDESAGFSVEGLKQARRSRRQETHLNTLEQVITWVQRRFFVDQGLGSPSAEVPSGRLCGWILSKWKHHMWRITWHWRCGRFGFGTSPLPYLSCNVDWQREIKTQIKEYQRDLSWHIYIYYIYDIFDIPYQLVNHVFFPKSGRSSWCDISEARPPAWRVWRPPRHGRCSCWRGMTAWSGSTRGSGASRERYDWRSFRLWFFSCEVPVILGVFLFVDLNLWTSFFLKVLGIHFFHHCFIFFLWKWAGVTVSCWLWGVLSLSRCAVAFKLKTGGVQCSNYVHRRGASWCRPCYWSWTGHVGRLRCTLDIDLHGSFENMELRLASQSEEESEHQSDFYLDIFG